MFTALSLIMLGRVLYGVLLLFSVILCMFLYVVARKTEWTYPTNRCIVSAFICATVSDVILSIIEFGRLGNLIELNTVNSLIAEMTLIGSIFLDALLLRNIIAKKRYKTLKSVILALITAGELILGYNCFFAEACGFRILIPGTSENIFNCILITIMLILIYASGYFSLKSIESSRVKTVSALVIALVVTVLAAAFLALGFSLDLQNATTALFR